MRVAKGHRDPRYVVMPLSHWHGVRVRMRRSEQFIAVDDAVRAEQRKIASLKHKVEHLIRRRAGVQCALAIRAIATLAAHLLRGIGCWTNRKDHGGDVHWHAVALVLNRDAVAVDEAEPLRHCRAING